MVQTRRESARIPLLRFVVAVLRQRRMVVGIPLGLFVLVVGFVLLSARTYTSTFSFTPVGLGSSLGQLAAMAAQAGFSLPTGAAGESPQFYADLVRTEEMLRRLATSEYAIVEDGDTLRGSILDLYEIEALTPDRSLHEAVLKLREKFISARPNRVTGVTIVTVRTKWPDLSLQLAEKIHRAVDEYNVVTRNSQARFERDFLAARVDSARASLRESESRMQSFLVANRAFRDDPRLVFEHDRIDREMNVRQDTYLALTRALEQARIEEVRNTPSVSLVEPPSRPLRADRRGTLLKGLLALFLGGLFALALVAVKEIFRHQGSTDVEPDADELRREVLAEMAMIPVLRRLVPSAHR